MIGNLVLAVVIAPLLTGEGVLTAQFRSTLRAPDLTAPQSLACSPQGSLWVADQLGTRIHLFAPGGAHIRSFGGEGQGPCEFTDRISLADPGGLFLYAADTDGSRIVKMTRSGLCVKEIRPSGGSEWGSISRPTAIASQRSGLLYVGDAGTGRIMTLDLFDHLVELTRQAVGGAPPFVEPSGLACREDRVYLTDGGREEVFVLDRFGNVLKRLPFEGVPGGIDCRADGLLAVVDDESDDVVFFSHLKEVDRLSELLPDYSLSQPRDVCFGRGEALYVADTGNDRVLEILIKTRVSGVDDALQ
jgi:DNA-binding beta-propeller fold protein YncE